MGMQPSSQDGLASEPESTHLRSWLLIPSDAPEWATNRAQLWDHAGLVERRYDAQEARFYDVRWPRELPLEATDEFISDLYGHFRDAGLAVQVDLETETASDGLPNPHLHAMISTRALRSDGFSRLKDRSLVTWFLAEGGTRPRRVVAELLTRIAVKHGIDVVFDHRPNSEQGLPFREDRLPRPYIRQPETDAAREALATRELQRARRHEWTAVAAEVEVLEQEIDALKEEQGVLLGGMGRVRPTTLQEARAARINSEVWKEICGSLPMPPGVPVDLGEGSLAIAIGDGALVDCGDELRIEGALDNDAALVMLHLAHAKGWTSVVIEDALDGTPVCPGFFTVAGIAAEPDPWPVFGASERLGIGMVVSAARSGRRLDAFQKAASPAAHEISQRLSILALDCVPDPTEDQVAGLMTAVTRSLEPGAALWEKWKLKLDFAWAGLKSPVSRHHLPLPELEAELAVPDL